MTVMTGLRLSHDDERQPRSRGRRADDFADLNTLPWQVRAIGLIGVPSAALLWLLWFIVPQIQAMPLMKTTIDEHVKAQTDHQSRMENWSRRQCVILARMAKDWQG